MLLLFVLVLGFFLFEAVIYGSHRLMHCRWTGPLWRSHHLHHQLYNPRHPATEQFQAVGWRSFRFRAIIFVIVVGLLFTLLPIGLAFPLLIEISLLAALSDYIHDATHTIGHWLEAFGWYRKLRIEHWVHHYNAKKNFGILTFFFDRAKGSYQAKL